MVDALTGTFLLDTPWAYPIIILGFWGMAYLEWKRGTRIALSYFFGGQFFAILGAAFLLWAATSLAPDWAWAAKEAASVDVGPSGGLFAGIAAAISVMPSPWRLRGWLVILAFVVVNMMFWGRSTTSNTFSPCCWSSPSTARCARSARPCASNGSSCSSAP